MTPPIMWLILLDSGPLSDVTHPRGNAETLDCKAWLTQMLLAGHRVLVPEICYYELRRELRRTELRAGVPSRGLQNLESLATRAGLVPITSEAIRLASDLWAQARHQTIQGAPDAALDGDMILCAQTLLLNPAEWNADGAQAMIATRNVAHLSSFAPAKHWRDLS
jgi:predicted nucleic acid-binding protein